MKLFYPNNIANYNLNGNESTEEWMGRLRIKETEDRLCPLGPLLHSQKKQNFNYKFIDRILEELTHK